jgi:hypothetical protein
MKKIIATIALVAFASSASAFFGVPQELFSPQEIRWRHTLIN